MDYILCGLATELSFENNVFLNALSKISADEILQ